MKKIFFLLLLYLLFRPALFAQCGPGACPPGAITTLPTSHIIAAGTTYCISGTINDVADYTINGTLIIQSGSVTLGNLAVSKTGSVLVNPGGRLMANSYTGEATAPASVISNITVCSYGYLYLSGAINPGETNFTVNDYGAFVIHGVLGLPSSAILILSWAWALLSKCAVLLRLKAVQGFLRRPAAVRLMS
ncbi:MAG: hypothetical protein WDO19_22320 [Bacteroidota bacterium]